MGSLPGQCDSLTSQGTAIYVTGSSAAKPFLQQIAQQLSTLRVYIVYTSTGSCVGVDAILNNTPMRTGTPPAPASSATYWSSTSDSGTACELPQQGVGADLGISDVFAQTCPGLELANLESSQVRDAHGPIQTMTFAVPANSIQTEISAQAAYFAFGFGNDSGIFDAAGVNPVWNDENYLLQRNASSGTQAMIAAAIGVPPGLWKGRSHKSSDELAAALQSASATQQTADKTLGILAADYIESKNLRAQIRALAYQDTRQPCAVYPDSTVSARDKRNVRDGHYPIWSPLHILYKVNTAGEPLNPEHRQQVLDIVGYMAGTKTLPNGIKLIDMYAQNGLIPECAMRVSRQNDGGNIQPYAPSSPCS
jgi:ABC-type phosphate transport system substrate-binding protein